METRLPVSMRATPTILWYTLTGVAGSISRAGTTNTVNSVADPGMNSTGWMLVNGSVAAGNDIGAHFTASAEL